MQCPDSVHVFECPCFLFRAFAWVQAKTVYICSFPALSVSRSRLKFSRSTRPLSVMALWVFSFFVLIYIPTVESLLSRTPTCGIFAPSNSIALPSCSLKGPTPLFHTHRSPVRSQYLALSPKWERSKQRYTRITLSSFPPVVLISFC